jgi:2-oxoglutarate dehydrogenase E2 component (dihydrolipoamide succinyltransferase)
MKIDVVMPGMGESITEGTVAKWLKKPGDPVEKDEALLEITTDKIDSEIPSPEAGVLAEVLVEEGATVEIGQLMARIERGGKAQPAEKPSPPLAQEVEDVPTSAEPALSPVARNIAEQEGLSISELRMIKGSGQHGRLTKSDLLGYLESREEEPKTQPTAEPVETPKVAETPVSEGRVEVIEMSTMRKTIAERMVQSKQISPHTYTVAEVDMSRIVGFRERIKHKFEQENGFKITYTHFVLHSTVVALKAFPLVNSSLEGDKILRKDFIHLGVAVALESGLIVPVIKNADEKNLLGLARASHELAVKAREKRLLPEDVQGGTFTVTNPGVFGNIFGFPIINQPQLGILGVGAIKNRPVVINDAIAIRSIMLLSLSYDHRVIDGALAARFVQKIRSALEDYDIQHAL